MQIEHFESIDRYYKTVKDYLLQHEATHCWMLAIGSRNFTQQSYLSVVTKDNKVLATAIKFPPPEELVLSKSLSEDAIALIAEDLVSRDESLPGIIAPQSEALAFAKVWQSLTGQSYRLDLAQRIYQLEVVKPINTANGYLHLATDSDRSLLIQWIQAFTEEAIGENEPKPDYRDVCDRRLRQHSRVP